MRSTRGRYRIAVCCRAKRNVTGDKAAWAFGKEFIALLRRYRLPALEGRAGAFFCIFWGEVSEDSDGPMEWCHPVPPDEEEALAARCPELTLRAEPAHQEAFVNIGDGQIDAADWQVVSRSLEAWAEQQPDILAADLGVRLTYLPSEFGQGTYQDFAIRFQRSATRMTTVVTAESLTKRFGEVPAVTDLSFALEAGTITGFLGPNGAGKTTTLRMILGLATPTSGRALVFDHPYAALPRAALRIGAVLEATDFHPGRSGRDHLRMLGRAVDVPDSRADEVLRLVELGDVAHRRVKGYSLGMRQRLGLAAALLGDPELLILDEPANGLDPEGVRWLRDFLHRLASEGRTVLISSHVLAEVAQTADRVLIISRGRLVLSSSLTELTARTGGAVRVRSGDPQRLTKALRDEALQVTTGTDHALLVQGASSERIGEIAFAAGVPVHELVNDAGLLEDIFLELTSGAPA